MRTWDQRVERLARNSGAHRANALLFGLLCLHCVTGVLLGPRNAFGEGPRRWHAEDVAVAALIRRPADVPKDIRVAQSPPRRVRWIQLSALSTDQRGVSSPRSAASVTPWGCWGDGCWASNQRYYTTVGNGLGKDGASIVLEFNPFNGCLRQLGTVSAKTGQFGYGKIQCRLFERDRWIYLVTHWSQPDQLEAALRSGYQGARLMRLHLDSHELQRVATIVPKRGFRTTHFDAQRDLLYLYCERDNQLIVFDCKENQRIFRGGERDIGACQAFMVDAAGQVYLNGQHGRMVRFDLRQRQLETAQIDLRAISRDVGKTPLVRTALPAPMDGGITLAMTGNGRLYLVDFSAERVTMLGANFGSGVDAPVMKLGPNQRYLYFVPTQGRKLGCPIVRYDIQKRKSAVVAFLRDAMAGKGCVLGGCHSLVLSGDGRQLCATFNAGGQPGGAAIGQPCIVCIDLE